MKRWWLIVGIGVVTLGCAAPLGNSGGSSSSSERKGMLGRLFAASSAASPAETPSASAEQPAPTTRQALYERLLFYPVQHPAGAWEPAGLRFEDVTFTASDGTALHGWFCPCDDARTVLLYCHGNGGNLSYDAELFRRLQQELHVTVFAFDYRGYGKSAGKPTVSGVLDDARAARTWAAKRCSIAESDVVLMGRSLGGAVVVQLAADTPPRGLVLESTFASLRETAAHHFPRLAWLVPRRELNSAVALASYAGPLLQSHGDADRTIPFAQAEELYNAATGPKQFFRITGGDHNDPQPATYYQRLDRFLAELP